MHGMISIEVGSRVVMFFVVWNRCFFSVLGNKKKKTGLVEVDGLCRVCIDDDLRISMACGGANSFFNGRLLRVSSSSFFFSFSPSLSSALSLLFLT